MYSTRIVVDIINCLSSPYGAVRRSARDATDLVMELDREEDGTPGNLGLQILKKRYEGFNRKWLAVLDGGDQTMTNTSGHFDDEEVNVHTSARSAANPSKGYKTTSRQL